MHNLWKNTISGENRSVALSLKTAFALVTGFVLVVSVDLYALGSAVGAFHAFTVSVDVNFDGLQFVYAVGFAVLAFSDADAYGYKRVRYRLGATLVLQGILGCLVDDSLAPDEGRGLR